jgi:hypothetical protein
MKRFVLVLICCLVTSAAICLLLLTKTPEVSRNELPEAVRASWLALNGALLRISPQRAHENKRFIIALMSDDPARETAVTFYRHLADRDRAGIQLLQAISPNLTTSRVKVLQAAYIRRLASEAGAADEAVHALESGPETREQIRSIALSMATSIRLRDPTPAAEQFFQNFTESVLAIHSDNAGLEAAAQNAKSLTAMVGSSEKIRAELEGQYSVRLDKLPAL